MTDDEQQLMKVGVDAAMKPFANLVEKLFGGSVEEIGGMWVDSLKVRRFKRQLKLFAKVKQMIADAGFEPHEIRDSVSIPLLMAATLEDDETLQEKWAALLTNAADPNSSPVLPSFSNILAELSSGQARFLDAIYVALLKFTAERKIEGPLFRVSLGDRGALLDIYITTKQYNADSFNVDVDTLQRLRLIEVFNEPVTDYVEALRTPPEDLAHEACRLTALGFALVEACRPPVARASKADAAPDPANSR
jgi:hypothetical protein